MKRQNIRTLSLVIITLTYLIIGAAVFDHFESTNEELEHDRLAKNISKFQLKHKMNDTEFNRLWNIILEKKPYYAGSQWRFVGSLYFCTVVVTLIGYGHSTPRTVSGKFFCIFYTVFGIPIFLIMFQSVGERLNSLIIFILTKIKKKLKLKNHDVGLFELITVEGFFSMTIILIASYVFMQNEDWTYFDAIYYCFITLLTIGFGDLVPLQKNNFLSNNLAYASFTILFILIGLTTLASSMNLLVLRLATINAEVQVQERLEQAEARRNAVHLDGDVISGNSRLFVQQEKPEQLETISVCSCACLDYKLFHTRHKKLKKNNVNNVNHKLGPKDRKYFTMPSIFQSNRSTPVKRILANNKKVKKTNHFSSGDIEIKNKVSDNMLVYRANGGNLDSDGVKFSEALTFSNLKRNSI